MIFFDYLINHLTISNLIYKRSATVVCITVAVVLIDLLVLGWRGSSLKKIVTFKKTTQADIALFFLGLTKFYYLLEIVFSFGVVYAFTHLVPQHKPKDYDLFDLRTIATILIVFVITDFLRYWYHRLFHQLEPLWQLHAYHHSAEELNVLAFYRHHFLEATCSRLLSYIPILLIGNSVYTIMPVWVLIYTIELLQHSSITSNWGLLGKYVIISPAAHRIHHSKNEQEFDKNFGQIFIFWDKLFGTYAEPHLRPIEVGLANNKFNKKGFLVDIFLVFADFIKTVKSKIFGSPTGRRVEF